MVYQSPRWIDATGLLSFVTRLFISFRSNLCCFHHAAQLFGLCNAILLREIEQVPSASPSRSQPQGWLCNRHRQKAKAHWSNSKTPSDMPPLPILRWRVHQHHRHLRRVRERFQVVLDLAMHLPPPYHQHFYCIKITRLVAKPLTSESTALIGSRSLSNAPIIWTISHWHLHDGHKQ